MITRDHFKYEVLELSDRADMTVDEMLAVSDTFYDKMKRRHSVRDFF